jgi:hypothetical protein
MLRWPNPYTFIFQHIGVANIARSIACVIVMWHDGGAAYGQHLLQMCWLKDTLHSSQWTFLATIIVWVWQVTDKEHRVPPEPNIPEVYARDRARIRRGSHVLLFGYTLFAFQIWVDAVRLPDITPEMKADIPAFCFFLHWYLVSSWAVPCMYAAMACCTWCCRRPSTQHERGPLV